jgi:alkylhydroperoxidase family enzyme
MSAAPRASPPPHKTGNVIRDSALGRVPETIEEIIELNRRVWEVSRVSASLLEVIRLRNARTVNCVFCRAVRYDVARRDGLTEERAQLIDEGYESSTLAPREKLAIALADAYLGYPAGVSAELASMMVALMTFNFTSRTAVAIGGMPEAPLPVVEISVAGTTGGPAARP